MLALFSMLLESLSDMAPRGTKTYNEALIALFEDFEYWDRVRQQLMEISV